MPNKILIANFIAFCIAHTTAARHASRGPLSPGSVGFFLILGTRRGMSRRVPLSETRWQTWILLEFYFCLAGTLHD